MLIWESKSARERKELQFRVLAAHLVENNEQIVLIHELANRTFEMLTKLLPSDVETTRAAARFSSLAEKVEAFSRDAGEHSKALRKLFDLE